MWLHFFHQCIRSATVKPIATKNHTRLRQGFGGPSAEA
jgi:hypothetical protein